MSVNNLTATFTYVQTNDTELGLDLCDNVPHYGFLVFS